MSDAPCKPGWEKRSLTSLAQYLNGRAFREDEWGKEGLPIIRIEQINDPSAISDRYDGSVLPQHLLDDGDLVFSWSATLKVVIWKHGPAALNQHLFKVVPNPDVDGLFLKQLLEMNMERLAASSQGSTMKHVTRSALERYGACVPTLENEQARIAEILSTVDEAIQGTEKLIAKHQQIKAGLMHDLFTRGLTPDGRLRPPHTEAPHLYKDSPLGPIPKEWECRTLKESIAFITDYRGKTPPYSTEGIPAISAENIGNGRIKSITKYVTTGVYKTWTTRGFPEPGDTLFTTEAPVGGVARLPSDQPYLLTRRIIGLRPVPDIDKGILFWQIYFLGLSGRWDRVVHGSTVPRILKPDILKQVIAVPSSDEQQRIAARLDSAELNTHLEEKRLEKLSDLRRGLMHDLLTGEVPVPIPEAADA